MEIQKLSGMRGPFTVTIQFSMETVEEAQQAVSTVQSLVGAAHPAKDDAQQLSSSGRDGLGTTIEVPIVESAPVAICPTVEEMVAAGHDPVAFDVPRQLISKRPDARRRAKTSHGIITLYDSTFQKIRLDNSF